MQNSEDKISEYYNTGTIMSTIVTTFESAGKLLTDLTPADLTPIDAFHIGGKVSTLELAALAQLSPGMRVLDVGCGLGGSVRHIAMEHGCMATGIDLTHEYIEVARQLSEFVGLGSKVSFKQGSALSLPFSDASFNVVWTEHAQMNIEDKPQFYRELAKVLKPGGRLVFHDVFQGPGGSPHYPVPWAEDPSLSALISADEARELITGSHLTIQSWIDKSNDSLQWFKKAAKKPQSPKHKLLSISLLLGTASLQKRRNIVCNLQENRIVVIQGSAIKQKD